MLDTNLFIISLSLVTIVSQGVFFFEILDTDNEKLLVIIFVSKKKY